jgi:phosphoribosylglycinamide formyltransferase-1
MSKSKIAIFASGNGTNAEEIIKYFQNHSGINVSVLLSNNFHAYALQRARNFDIPCYHFSREQFKDSAYLLGLLTKHEVTHIVLAGFLWLLPSYLIKAFPGRIINIHPALLPKFGGKGMYGKSVHEAVKTSGEKETGITIHEVNEKYDEGRIIFQDRCRIFPNDTPEQIAEKVHALEYKHYPKVIERWIEG